MKWKNEMTHDMGTQLIWGLWGLLVGTCSTTLNSKFYEVWAISMGGSQNSRVVATLRVHVDHTACINPKLKNLTLNRIGPHLGFMFFLVKGLFYKS